MSSGKAERGGLLSRLTEEPKRWFRIVTRIYRRMAEVRRMIVSFARAYFLDKRKVDAKELFDAFDERLQLVLFRAAVKRGIVFNFDPVT
jgi:hypothetical protein